MAVIPLGIVGSSPGILSPGCHNVYAARSGGGKPAVRLFELPDGLSSVKREPLTPTAC